MLSFAQIRNCEGYFFNTRTDTLLRVVRSRTLGDWPGEQPLDTVAAVDGEELVFERVTDEPSTPLADVEAMVRERFGTSAKVLVYRQTAEEPECELPKFG